MPHNFKLPSKLSKRGWKVKIFEKEIVEPPHASVVKRRKIWRWDLRNEEFMDEVPPKRDVDKSLIIFLKQNRDDLVKMWDKKYPHNPVQSIDESEEES